MFEGAALAFRFEPFNGEDCRAYPAYLAVPADLSVVADLILAGDPIVVVDQSAVVDPTAPADRTVGRVRIVEAVRNVPAVHISAQIVEAARSVPAVHTSAQIAAEALLFLAVAPSAVVDHYVEPALNVTVRNGVRNAANEVQISLEAQLGPDATVSPKVRRTVQIEAFPLWVGYRKPVLKDATTLFVHVDHENVSPRHHRLAAQVERPSPVDCLLFLADELTAIQLQLAGALVYFRRRNSSAMQESSPLILTASMNHLPDSKRQDSSVHRYAPHEVDA